MPIKSIKIQYYKSFKDCKALLKDVNIIIGENGSGKSNFIEAIDYFYQNLTETHLSDTVFDANNRYSNCIRIGVSYDLSHLHAIAKNKRKLSEEGKNVPYLSFFEKILRIAESGKNSIVTVEMEQIRKKGIRWNYNYEDRAFLKGLFPLYKLDCHNIDIYDWQSIWNVLGAAANVSDSEKGRILQEIKKISIESSTEIGQRMSAIQNIFENAGITSKGTSKDFIVSLMRILNQGNKFTKSGRELSYYSTGTNSLQYIQLYLRAIFYLSKSKIKEPFILLDEPEINLHHIYIDQLCAEVAKAQNFVTFIIATHSPRMVKNFIRLEKAEKIYSLKMIRNYSSIQHLTFFNGDRRATIASSDELANAYFSKAMLLVEGATELELLSNRMLREIFPYMKYVDVFTVASDKTAKDQLSPAKTHEKTPYIAVIDMDKVIQYNRKERHFFIPATSWMNSEIPHEKERFSFKGKKDTSVPEMRNQRARIVAMTNRCQFHISGDLYMCNDPNYYDYVRAIKEYLLQYNVFPCRTTVEGIIINRKSIGYIEKYICEKLRKNSYSDNDRKLHELLKSMSVVEQDNFLRLTFHGKSDLLQGEKNANFSDEMKSMRETIRKEVCQKKTTWLSEYLDFYFKEVASELGYSNQYDRNHLMSRISSDEQFRLSIKEKFEKDYPELVELLHLSETLVCDII